MSSVVERLTTMPQVEALKPDWDQLLSRVPGHSFFMTWEWLATWWEVFGQGGDLWWLLVRDNTGRLIGAAPLYRRRSADRWMLPHREVRFVGTGAAVCPEHLDILAEAGREGEVALSIADYLRQHAAAWDLLCLTDISAPCAVADAVTAVLSRTGARPVRREQAPGAPSIRLPESWDVFVKGLKSSLRGNIARRRRNVAHDLGAEFHVWSKDDGDLSAAMREFEALHASRKSDRGMSNKFDVTGYRAFQHRLAERLADQGRLYLATLRKDGRAIAVEYAFTYQGRVYGYQTGFDPQYGQHGVYQVLLGYVIEDAIARGCHEVDLLRGEQPYKLDWTETVRRKWIISCFSPTQSGRLLYGLFAARRWCGRMLRIVRQEGLAGLARRIRALIFRKDALVFYVLHGTDQPLSGSSNGLQIEVWRDADGAKLGELARLKGRGKSVQAIQRRFRRGHVCLAALRHGRLVYASWLNLQGWSVVDGREYPLPPGAAFRYDAFTIPEARGQGIARRVFHCAHQQLGRWDKQSLYALVSPGNTASVKSLKGEGFAPTAVSVGRVKILGCEFAYRIPTLGAP